MNFKYQKYLDITVEFNKTEKALSDYKKYRNKLKRLLRPINKNKSEYLTDVFKIEKYNVIAKKYNLICFNIIGGKLK